MKQPFVKPRYSGVPSTAFWNKVNALPEPHRSAAYSLGVALQNVELDLLHLINCHAEEGAVDA